MLTVLCKSRCPAVVPDTCRRCYHPLPIYVHTHPTGSPHRGDTMRIVHCESVK